MKHQLLCIALVVGLATPNFAQKETEAKKNDKVPAIAKTAFEKKFIGAKKVKWGKEGADFESSFVLDGKKMAAVYDASGNLKETEWTINTSDLPTVVLNYVKEHYKGAKIAEAAKIQKPNGEITFEAEVNGKDVLFTADGKFIKEVKD